MSGGVVLDCLMIVQAGSVRDNVVVIRTCRIEAKW